MEQSNHYDLGQLGRERLEGFCKTLKKLLVDEAVQFDVIVAAGNSGLAMSSFAFMVFDALHISRPMLLKVPFFRYLPRHNDDPQHLFLISTFEDEIRAQLDDIKLQSNNFLFVDDEIGQGITALGMYSLIKPGLAELNRVENFGYYIVAEDQGFKVPANLTDIHFHSFSKEIEGLNNIIFYMIPAEFEDPIIKALGDDEKFTFHWRANLLLDLPIKDYNNGNPVFSDKWLDKARNDIPEFTRLQMQFQKYIMKDIAKLTQ